MNLRHISAYHFFCHNNLEAEQKCLKDFLNQRDLMGTILLGSEGVNLFLTGTEENILEFKNYIFNELKWPFFDFKWSKSSKHAYTRKLVKIKDEVVTFRRPELDMQNVNAPRVSPRQLQEWLKSDKPVVLVDTRNSYEVAAGKFKGAEVFDIENFCEFPEKVQSKIEEWKDKTVVSYCTGGIRCEKAAPYLQKVGLSNVYQLDGGILNYFKDCGNDHYEGGCYVFDKRMVIYPEDMIQGPAVNSA